MRHISQPSGKAKVLIPSLVCYAIFGTAGAFANSFAPLLISRALLGAASGGIPTPSIRILSSMYEGEKQTNFRLYNQCIRNRQHYFSPCQRFTS